MKRFGQLWPQVTDFANLHAAYRKARLGKSQRRGVAEFALNLESELLSLQDELREGSYQPGAYRLFTVYERKPRLIAAAPFRDRVVHHAVMNVIEPLIDRRFIDDCYACRRGRGVHAAVDRYQGWSRQYRYAMKLDVKRYFPSIDHDVLKASLSRHIKDAQLLGLMNRIIDTAPDNRDDALTYYPGDDLFSPLQRRRGIPIGNLTSQFFANIYLNSFDHWVREALRVPGYLRYVDDMVFLDNDKAHLHEIRRQVEEKLAALRLRIHPDKIQVVPTGTGLDLLGYRVFPSLRRLRNDNGRRFAHKLRRYARAYRHGVMDWPAVNARVQSWIGHAAQADTLGLRQAIFREVIFTKGADRMAASA
jgi:retron-type reverse transcriptase